jgi:predicted ATPase
MVPNNTPPLRQRRNFRNRSTGEERLGDDAVPVPRSLLFPKELYGRDQEQHLLVQAFRRVADKTSPSSEVVFVHGRSGAGKTALVQSMNAILRMDSRLCNDESDILFVAGKYDQLLSTDPYSALSSALSDLVKKVTTNNASGLSKIRTAVLESVDVEDLPTLSALIPNLNRIVCVQHSSRAPGRSNQEQAYAKLLSTVCSFVRSVIAATSPTVIFLDDLQFASAASIELIRALATDISICGMLLVLTYRTEEVECDSSLKLFIDTMLRESNNDEQFRHPASEIEVTNLLVKDIDQIVRGVTRIDDEEETLSLSRVILQKTLGQAFHVIQFMEMLKDRHFLYYENGRYRFDLDRVQEETNVSENVASLVSERIQKLPSTTRNLLALAACLGFCFATEHFVGLALCERHRAKLLVTADVDIVDDDSEDGDIDIEGIELALTTCVAEGLLEFANETDVKFSHDQIHQALLMSIPPEIKPHLHLRIGKYLLGAVSDAAPGTEASFFLAVDQFSRSQDIICAVEDVADLCRVNLLAGKLSVAKCAFAQGADFLQVAAAMASKADLWNHHYDLALDVFTLSAEYESYAGRLERSYELVDMVLANATKLEDKLRPYFVRFYGLTCEERFVEAVDLGLMLLEKLGEKLQRQLTVLQTIGRTVKISWLLRRRCILDVGAMDEISNWKLTTTMRVLSLLWGTAWYSGDSGLFVAVTLKSISLTLKWGHSPFSASALATFARLLVALNRTDESYRVGQLALEVHKKWGSKENEGLLFILLTSFVNYSRESSRDQLPLISRAYDSEYACGHNVYAMITVLIRLQVSFLVGVPLSALKHDCTALLSNTSNRLATTCAQPVIQLISCLQDGTRKCNPWALSGEIQDECEFAVMCEASGNERALVLLWTYQIAQAFFFHKWDRAVEIYERLTTVHKNQWKTTKANVVHVPLTMWIGSAYMILARFNSLYISKARRLLRNCRRVAAAGNPDAIVYTKMLEAEYAALTSTPAKVRDAFECAIAACQASGFVHYEAHLSERLGIVLVELGHFDMAARYHLKTAWNQ